MDAQPQETAFKDRLEAFKAAHPHVSEVEVFLVDLNGLARGKLMPIDLMAKAATGGIRMPISALGLDIFGSDVAENAIAIERGDPDGPLLPVPETLSALPWAPGRAQLQCMMAEPDGTVAAYDPRGVLMRVADRAKVMGYAPVMALELEFFLIDPSEIRPPDCPVTGVTLSRAQIYDMTVATAFAPIISEIREAAEATGAPAEGTICEFGPGQFEMNLRHTDDALAAADHMVALKRAIRGVAWARGLDATFMPKPYGEQAGSGQHIHLSLLDAAGANAFAADNADTPSPLIAQAVAGLLETMADAMLVFAPNLNSYRRFIPGNYAPMSAAWGLDNRGTAVRLPERTGPGARLEHRVAGADANPYLLAAVVLAGALAGIERGAMPPPPVANEAAPGDGAPLPLDWLTAEQRFAASPFIANWLGGEAQRIYAGMKRQERATLLSRVADVEYDAYLRVL